MEKGRATLDVVTPPAQPVAPGDTVRVRVRALASNGAGVADLPDGRVTFVQRTVPGDTAEVRVTRVKKRWAESSLVRVVEPSEDRVEPPCPLFAECGGCTLQHVAYERQLEWKGRFVADALGRLGSLKVEPPIVEASPATYRYRNRMTFTLRRLGGGRVVAGLHAQGDPDRIVDIGDQCLLPEPPIADAWARLRRVWRAGDRPLPPARELRLTLRSVQDPDTGEEGVLLLVRGGSEEWHPRELVERVAGLRAIWHHPDGHRHPILVHGDPLEEAWGDEQVPVGGYAFLQVNRDAAENLVAHVLGHRGSGSTAVDAYCGVGVYGRALARDGWSVTGIEWDRDAVAAARHGAPETFQVVQGPVEDHLGAALPADLVVLNPPRTGVQEWVPGTLLHHHPRRVIYVSCDPATLARDAERLAPGYGLTSLRSFDLFPQTGHVETVAVFDAHRSESRRWADRPPQTSQDG